MARHGNNILIAKKKRIEQVEYLIENMRNPDTRFNDLFGDDELNTASITLRILNTINHGGPRSNNFETINSFFSLASFMNSIQEYFPKKMRVKYKLWSQYSFNGETLSEEMKEAMQNLSEWFCNMKYKVLDVITGNYYIEGKVQQLEILKRRFKELYSERTEQNINADINEDSDINITIAEVVDNNTEAGNEDEQ